MDILRKKLRIPENGQLRPAAVEDKKDSAFNKNKLLATWYNMKYGKAMFSLDTNTSFTIHSPVWLLGQCYHRRMRQRIHYADQAQSIREIDSGIASFQEDFASKIWFTYRKNFEEFKGTDLGTDCGWGCMIRTGQMMLANALLQLKLGRHWRWNSNDRSQVQLAENICQEIMHRNVIRLFGDTSDDLVNPLSIHSLMDVAADMFNRKPGDWFGPTTTAHILKRTFDKHRDEHPLLRHLRVYVAKDGTVFKEDVYNMCKITREMIKVSSSFDSLINMDEYSIIDPNELLQSSHQLSPPQFEVHGYVPYIMSECENIHVENEDNVLPSLRKQRSNSVPSLQSYSSSWIPVLVLIPVKLGRDNKVNPIYAHCLKSFLATDTCLGIMGGKPKHSLYFVGFQDDNLIHLDPHLSQEKVDVFQEEFGLDTFHSNTPRKLSLSKMDSSCCLGFLIESENQFHGWCELATELAKPTSGQHLSCGLFTIAEGTSTDHLHQQEPEVLSYVQQLDSIDEAGIDANIMIPTNEEEEEFVFL